MKIWLREEEPERREDIRTSGPLVPTGEFSLIEFEGAGEEVFHCGMSFVFVLGEDAVPGAVEAEVGDIFGTGFFESFFEAIALGYGDGVVIGAVDEEEGGGVGAGVADGGVIACAFFELVFLDSEKAPDDGLAVFPVQEVGGGGGGADGLDEARLILVGAIALETCVLLGKA